MLAALEVDPRKLPAVERAYERIAGRLKVVFEVNKAPAKTQVPGEVSPVGRECPCAPASLPVWGIRPCLYYPIPTRAPAARFQPRARTGRGRSAAKHAKASS